MKCYEMGSSPSTDEVNQLLALTALFKDDFSMDWIQELTGLKGSRVLSILEELVNKGYMKRQQTGFYRLSNSKEDSIKHRLSAEEQLEYHQRISQIILAELMGDSTKAKLVSHHLLLTFNNLRKCHWLKKAGDIFLAEFDTEQALKCYLKVLEDLTNVDGEDAESLFIETTLQYSKISMARQETTKVLSLLESALKLATKLNKLSYTALLKMHLAKNEWFRSHYNSAMIYFEEGSAIAKSLDDNQMLRKMDMFHIFFYFWQGRFRDVINSYERFVPEVTRFPEGRFPLLSVEIAGFCYAQSGQLNQGLGIFDSMRRHTKEIGDYHMMSHAEGSIGIVLLDIMKNDEALPYLERAREMADREHNGWITILSRLCLAYLYYTKDEIKKSIKYLKEFIRLSSKVEVSVWPHQYLLKLCWAMEEKKFPAFTAFSLREEIEKLSKTRNAFMQGIAYRYRALLESREGAPYEMISKSLSLSLKWLEASGSQIERAKTQIEIARQDLFAGKEDDARKILISASRILNPLNEALIPDDLRPLIIKESSEKELLTEILKIGQEIVNIRNSKELALKIISSTNRITGAERGALFLTNGMNFEMKASKNLTQEQISHTDFLPQLKLIREVARTGKGFIKGRSGDGISSSMSDSETIRSVICVPMIFRDEVAGVLYHDNRLLNNAFHENDLDSLSYIAAQAAIVLDNVKYYEEIQQVNRKLTEENRYLEDLCFNNDIVGKSISIKRVMEQIQQVAPTDANVLVLGNTGVGKELVANAIHKNSPRKDKPFVCVQCSALPESLLPSELFGHERGAFTGALKRRIGRFELADGGTLFLDEIGDLHLDMQVQLLRAIETKQFERIGGSDTLKSDFRLIAATNRDLEREVSAGRFRMDLYYRLNVFPIYVPSLADRREDIPLLVDYFVSLYSKKSKKVFESIAQEGMEDLLKYSWPGNVRELENLVERAVILNNGKSINFSGLLPVPGTKASLPDSIEVSLSDNERFHIIRALELKSWKVSGPGGAAELLKINPSTLTFKMKKLGIKRPLSIKNTSVLNCNRPPIFMSR